MHCNHEYETIIKYFILAVFFSESYRLGKSNVSLVFETILQFKMLAKSSRDM